jgi:hydroxymethylpyrimidine pyrophosphatase-like HAD family hydrolase
MTLEPKMKKITEGCVAVSYSSNRYMEFNQLGVDKGQGLKDLAALLGIDIKDTIAVGDNYNDMAMLKVAGLSIAANNAVQDIKDICDVTTKADNNEGVVAELIERFIFNHEI